MTAASGCLPTDYLGVAGPGDVGAGAACRARRHDDFSYSPVFGVDQQNHVVVELEILKVLGGGNLSGNFRRQLLWEHRWWQRGADSRLESCRRLALFALEALHDRLFLLSRQIELCRRSDSNTSEKRDHNCATINTLTHDVSPACPRHGSLNARCGRSVPCDFDELVSKSCIAAPRKAQFNLG